MVAKKRKSKRQTLQQKYKIIKRTKEHHRKIKKGKITATANQQQRKQSLKRAENRIPNAWPYKEELLKEIEEAKEKMEAVKAAQKQRRKEEMMKRRGLISGNAESSMEVTEEGDGENKSKLLFLSQGQQNNNHHNHESDAEEDEEEMKQENSNNNLGQNSRRAYLRDLKKVIEKSDVIIHVLDCRDPLGTKSKIIEEMVGEHSRKKLIYVLNKADLVPREVLQGWLHYLRQFYPTIPFKCNTQQQKGNLASGSGKVLSQQKELLQSSRSIGSEELLNVLKNYCRLDHSNVKSIITVGIVGYPNVGKSSLINSLMRIRAVGVSSTAGFTKHLQEVILDKNIRLIDCPGIVFSDGNDANTALRNCVNTKDLTDFHTPIQAILDKCPAAYLMQIYGIPSFPERDVDQFLLSVGKSMGKLQKGGTVNKREAARQVLDDWNNGKIKYYCKPPASFLSNLQLKGVGEETKDNNVSSSGRGKGRNNNSDEGLMDLDAIEESVLSQLQGEGSVVGGRVGKSSNDSDLYVAVD